MRPLPPSMVGVPGVVAAVAVTVLLLGLAAPAGASQTITVATTTDAVDPTPADGTCDSPCSLRGAIQTANDEVGSPGADVISVPANGTAYTLKVKPTGDDAAASGDLDLNSDITITGAGAGSTVIDGGALDRVFDARKGTIDISGVTIQNGAPQDDPGGGLRAVGTSIVTLHDATVTGNSLPNGTAGGGVGTLDDASLTLTRVALNGNTALHGGFGDCGGAAEENDSTAIGGLRIESSTVSGNTQSFGGAACENGGGKLDVVNSTVSGNTTAGNFTIDVGGGLLEDGSGILTVTDSTISGNTAGIGGGIMEDGGGTIVVDRSTISGNHARARTGATPAANNGSGGGVGQDSTGKITITNSTISGNQADLSGGGMHLAGTPTQPITVTNSTIDGNTASSGGALNVAGGTLRLRNSIVSGGGGGNCATAGGTIASDGHNIDSGTTCGFGAPGDQANTDPKLNALADNGGPTQTQALQDGSPAIDAADPIGCPPTDQRGATRPFGPGCDIGAFEGGVPLTPGPPVVPLISPKESPDLAAARHPTCLSIPKVVRDQRKAVPGGHLVLRTRQVDDAAMPLKTSVALVGKGGIRSVTIRVNGRVVTTPSRLARGASAAPPGVSVPVGRLRVGSRARRNKVTATVVLSNGRRVVLTQFMVVLRCHVPATSCRRQSDGRSMRCQSRTPVGGRRVRVTVTKLVTERATGSARVRKGRYTVTVHSTSPLSAGTYAYKHVVTTRNPHLRFFMIRLVRVT